jgi:DNA-binding CsgD family transcriptional regulator
MRVCAIFRDVTERVRIGHVLQAKQQIAEALLAGRHLGEVLTIVARHARRLVDATDAAVVTAGDPPGTIMVMAADGPVFRDVIGRRFTPPTVGSDVMKLQRGMIFDDLSAAAQYEEGQQLGMGPTIVVPMLSTDQVFGNIMVGTTTPGHRGYDADDLAVVETLAKSAGVALSLVQARDEVRRLALIAKNALAVATSPLTDAELTVLRYLPTHLTYSMIADARYVTRHTIKSQVKSIYAKLRVGNRRDAVDTARALGLLPPPFPVPDERED